MRPALHIGDADVILQDWKQRYNILIGGYSSDLPPGYSALLVRSKYCLVAPGDGYSARMEDAILHGCVPVIVMDGVQVGRTGTCARSTDPVQRSSLYALCFCVV